MATGRAVAHSPFRAVPGATDSTIADRERIARYLSECPECMLGRSILFAIAEVALIVGVWVAW